MGGDIRKTLGVRGEQIVADLLLKQGYTICACNYRQKCGEIDIIASQQELVVFVEVKLRTKQYMTIAELVPLSKQKKIIKTAYYYINSNKLYNNIYRFDVALIESPSGNYQNTQDYAVTYFTNAFTLPESLA